MIMEKVLSLGLTSVQEYIGLFDRFDVSNVRGVSVGEVNRQISSTYTMTFIQCMSVSFV